MVRWDATCAGVGTFVAGLMAAYLLRGCLGCVVGAEGLERFRALTGTTKGLTLTPGLRCAWRMLARHRSPAERVDNSEELELAVLSILGSLRVGCNLVTALRSASEEARGSVGTALREFMRKYDAGVPLAECVKDLGKHKHLGPEARLVAAALEVLRVTGSNATEALLNVASTIVERRLMRGEIRARTADVRMSARLLRGAPLLLTAYMFVAMPDLARVTLQKPVGRLALVYSFLSWGLGVLLIWKLERTEPG